jgi:hypothetical protein
MPNKVYRRAGNIAADIGDLNHVSINFTIVYMLPTIANMFDCIVVACNQLDGLH